MFFLLENIQEREKTLGRGRGYNGFRDKDEYYRAAGAYQQQQQDDWDRLQESSIYRGVEVTDAGSHQTIGVDGARRSRDVLPNGTIVNDHSTVYGYDQNGTHQTDGDMKINNG